MNMELVCYLKGMNLLLIYNKINNRLQTDGSENGYCHSVTSLLPFLCHMKAYRLKYNHITKILVVFFLCNSLLRLFQN
jgi:hypothetical protein